MQPHRRRPPASLDESKFVNEERARTYSSDRCGGKAREDGDGLELHDGEVRGRRGEVVKEDGLNAREELFAAAELGLTGRLLYSTTTARSGHPAIPANTTLAGAGTNVGENSVRQLRSAG